MESKKAFQRGNAPATEYRDPKGNVVKIDPKDRKIEQLRNQLSEERWRTREARQQAFYSSYYSRPVVVYHDPYSSFFWYWLLDRSINDQAMWVYNHRAAMDAARYNDMLAKNAELAARVRALEAQNAPRDPAYKPIGLNDVDLMYDDNYVNAVYNPTPRPGYVPPRPGGSSYDIVLFTILGVAVAIIIIWLIFVKRWE